MRRREIMPNVLHDRTVAFLAAAEGAEQSELRP
jgi:hypothetical protein